jgi:hypothetical protein
VDTPFTEGYDIVFIAALWFNDHTLEIKDAHFVPGEVDWQAFDRVLRFRNGRLVVAK